MENLDIDKTLINNIASSDVTDPVFNAIKSTRIIQVYKKLKISRAVKI